MTDTAKRRGAFGVPRGSVGCGWCLLPRLVFLPSHSVSASAGGFLLPRLRVIPCCSVPAIPTRLQILPAVPLRVFLLSCHFYEAAWHCMGFLAPMLRLLSAAALSHSQARRRLRGTSRGTFRDDNGPLEGPCGFAAAFALCQLLRCFKHQPGLREHL